MELSEEEKKAIEILKIWKVESISSKCIYDTISVEVYNKALKTLLNLIENQAKEIELKDKEIEKLKMFQCNAKCMKRYKL